MARPIITVVGSFAVGMTIRTSHMPIFGETLIGADFDMGPGGKGSNQAVGTAQRVAHEVVQADVEAYKHELAAGKATLKRGEIDLSIEHLDQTIKDARAARFTAGEMLARMFLSIVYTDLGRYDQALAVLAAGQPSSMDNLAIARAFSFGPELLMYARAGNISAAEEVAAGFDVDAEGGYFVAKYNFKLGQCYLYLAKSELISQKHLCLNWFTPAQYS